MKRVAYVLAWVLPVSVLATAYLAVADTGKDARYQVIPDRNAFSLKPPPEPAPPPPPPPPTTTVKLTGIVSLLGNKSALLVVQEQGKKPETLIMQEGERQGQVEVLAIDVDASTVKVRNFDRESVLNMKDDGVKPPPPAAAGAQPANLSAGTVVKQAPGLPTPTAMRAGVGGTPGQPAGATAANLHNPATRLSVTRPVREPSSAPVVIYQSPTGQVVIPFPQRPTRPMVP